PDVTAIGSPQFGTKAEFRVTNIPTVPNPFDPDVVRVDALFVFPSGRTLTVPAFWYQGYTRSLSGGMESLNPSGVAEWRVRFTPTERGAYNVSVTARANGQFLASSSSHPFSISASASGARTGYVQLASSKQYFETSDGQALRLIGENVCWPG